MALLGSSMSAIGRHKADIETVLMDVCFRR
jgi:hypothetical protein